ncbi:hypothetical protein [Thiobacillus sedimenti]|uniref:Uncharacterized protein n=1 Tax=Thiobacillus sedimenti TaxID=3110231 RepID=A0ABZ1CIK7_9PROT|nr:hypothetical protein [Thiobacillus sp. SCUT-2]WRS39239.1 hypothetical protein VA613_14725 [Thiobacillus sp. SCUT-2]
MGQNEYEKWVTSLVKRFPLLYRGRRRGEADFYLRGLGWFPVIEKLSEELEIEIRRLRDEEGVPVRRLPRAFRVKEKFGKLRFQIVNPTPAVFDAIFKAEQEAATRCEICGRTATPSQTGELVLCPEHMHLRIKDEV